MKLRFHWMLPKAGEVSPGTSATPRAAADYRLGATHPGSPAGRPDMAGWLPFAHRAEEAGIEKVLISISRYEPDPLFVACALGRATDKLGFIIAYRSGLMQPTYFVQQLNTLSTLIPGRVALNIVAGSAIAEQQGYGDFLAHDDRYARAEEFLAVCHAYWHGDGVDFDGAHYQVEGGKLHTPYAGVDRSAPEIYVSGHSQRAEELARSRGTCWLRAAEAPETLAPLVARSRQQGLDVCLRACLVCRPTREEAFEVACSLLPRATDGAQRTPPHRDDSQMYRESASQDACWLTPNLWTGLVAHYGPVWTTLLGTPQELADAFLAYQRIGVSQFILSGWPEDEEVGRFGREVLPLVRAAEGRG